MSPSKTLAPPLYDEVDYILAPETRIDLKTFLSEFPTPEDVHRKKKPREPVEPPEYSCTVSRCGQIMRKMENVISDEPGKVYYPFRRNWTEVFCVVRGTKLEIYRCPSSRKRFAMRPTSQDGTISRRSSMPAEPTQPGIVVRPRSASTADIPPEPELSDLITEYSLLGAVAGVACDYIKKANVLRVRVERDQFLIECNDSRDAIDWLETIQQAANISEPLESRIEPRFICAPRRHRGKGKDQPYEIFEAAPGTPLRQRTHCSLRGPRSSSSRGLTAAARATEAAIQRAELRRALLHSLNLDSDSQDSGVSGRPQVSESGVRDRLHPHSVRSDKRHTTAALRPRKPQAERFVCAVLPATLSRKPLACHKGSQVII